MSDLTSLAQKLQKDDSNLILVTLVSVEGSTYRKPGAQMLLTAHGYYGLMSGGCLEAEITRQCRPIFEGEKRALKLEIDTRQYLGCDGRLALWCERISHSFFATIQEVIRKRRGLYCNIFPDDNKREATLSEHADTSAFSHRVLPPRRLLVFGSAPDAQPLLKLGRALEWQSEQVVLSSDPLSRHSQNFLVLAESRLVSKLNIDSTTACVVMNHHFGRDLELVQALWKSSSPFLGLLGSRKRKDQLLEKLVFNPQIDLESRHLFAPVGLELGAEGPQQIALEICAQIQQVLSVAKPSILIREGT